jgi:hypothetical protein
MGTTMLRALLAPALAFALAAPALASDGPTLTPAQRGQMAREFVLKWSTYVERVEGQPLRPWAMRLAPAFGRADAANVRRALKRETLEGALAELAGRGQRLSDGEIIDAHAAAGLPEGSKFRERAIQALGSLTGDLVFTPVAPCRIFDTRVQGGAIAGNNSRNFAAVSTGGSFEFQGGSTTNCGLSGVGASAVVLSVTAVYPSNNGFTTVWKYGDTRPTAASATYSAGQLISNTVFVRIPNPLAIFDISVFTSSQSHYVADIVGYFSAPQATRLDCVATSIVSTNIAASTSTFINNLSCPTGYDATTPYCYSPVAGVNSAGSGYNSNAPGATTFCAWHNTTGSTQQVYGGQVCCRVPGR